MEKYERSSVGGGGEREEKKERDRFFISDFCLTYFFVFVSMEIFRIE